MANGNDQDQVTFRSPTTGAVQPVPQEHWDEALKQGYRPTSHVVMYDLSGNRGMVPKEQAGQYRDKGYSVTAPGSETQFERDRPGRGITWQGAGQAAWETAKQIPGGVGQMLDPTRGLSGAGLAAIGLNPRSGTVSQRLGETPIAGAVKEMRSAYRDPTASGWEVPVAGVGSLLGMSAEKARASAMRGEGGQVLGQAAVPTAMTLAGPIAGEVLPRVRPMLQRAAFKELPTTGAPQLTRSARATGSLLGAGTGAAVGG